MNLSPHFTLLECIASETAARLGIDNSLPAELLPHAISVAMVIAEPARAALGRLHCNSWYRCPALNREIPNASPTSQHMEAEAIDLIPVDGPSVFDLLLWIYRNVEFDELIWEFGGAWCHASHSLDGPQRRLVKAAVLGPPDVNGKRHARYSDLTGDQIIRLGR